MGWQPVDITKEEAIACVAAFPKEVCFLVDENLGAELVPLLRRFGCEARRCAPKELDRDAEANGSRQTILLAQDNSVLDPGPLRPDAALVAALLQALSILGKQGVLRRPAKILVGEDGRLTVASSRQTTHYKLRLAGPPLVWSASPARVFA